MICHYSSLNMAIDLGFSGRKQIASDQNEYVAPKGKVTQLKQLVGGRMLNQASPMEIAVRVQIIEVLVECMCEEEVEVADVEECLDDFMETNFNTLSDEFSHTEMAH